MNMIAVTSIASQNSVGISKLINFAKDNKAELVIIGDKKTPDWDKSILPPYVHYFSVQDQIDKWPTLANKLPFNHYARKNLAYLWAIEHKVSILLDTDDDNCSSSRVFEQNINQFRTIDNDSEWLNIYGYFGKSEIWPRGVPLDEARKRLPAVSNSLTETNWHGFQAIVDGDPDLDAIGRMLYPEAHYFEDLSPIILPEIGFCPTNSQATLWKSEILPFLYLPVTSTFRMTDIWRGILISGLMKKEKLVMAFGKLGFLQERNEHNILGDFLDEVSGHQFSRKVRKISDAFWLGDFTEYEDDFNCLISIYTELIKEGLLSDLDLECLREFIRLTKTYSE